MSIRKIRMLFGVFLAFLAIFLIVTNLISAFFIRVPMNSVGDQRFDVIITLGYPALQDGQPSPVMKQRVVQSVNLYNRHHADHLILTGGAAHNRFVEAEVMAEVARSMGVPATNIIEETKAKTLVRMP